MLPTCGRCNIFVVLRTTTAVAANRQQLARLATSSLHSHVVCASAVAGGRTMASAVQAEKVLARKLVSAALKALSDEQMARQSALYACLSHAAPRSAPAVVQPPHKIAHSPQRAPNAQRTAPGAAICEKVLAADFFAPSRRVGAYVSCARLREVDTTAVLSHIFASAPSALALTARGTHPRLGWGLAGSTRCARLCERLAARAAAPGSRRPP